MEPKVQKTVEARKPRKLFLDWLVTVLSSRSPEPNQDMSARVQSVVNPGGM